jgi:hypothetical protein
VPVAVNAAVVPSANDGLTGVTAIEISTGGPTASAADAVMAPAVAVIDEFPTPMPVANPTLFTPATDGSEEAQVTRLVRSCMLPSE